MLLRPRSNRDEQRTALDALRRIVRALRLSSTDLERKLGVSVAQLFVLEQLADGAPRSIRQLADEALTDPSSVSVVVARLLARKLISRRADRADARRAQLTLTAAGRAVLARAPEPLQTRLLAALKALPPRRVRELASTLDRLAGAVGGAEPMLFFEDTPRRRKR